MKSKNLILIIAIVALVAILGTLVAGYIGKAMEGELQNPVVTMEIAGYGTVKIELYPEYAPNTVNNFVKLVEEGYYDGLTFHRVISDVLIQGGDKEGTGAGDTDFSIPGEFLANGFTQNTLRHEVGTISMARADYSTLSADLVDDGYNSAGTQFFISLESRTSFDGLYAPFGKVTEGLEHVQAISKVATTVEEEQPTEMPAEQVIITKMTVDTFGVDYPDPETMVPFDYNEWLMSQYGDMLQY